MYNGSTQFMIVEMTKDDILMLIIVCGIGSGIVLRIGKKLIKEVI